MHYNQNTELVHEDKIYTYISKEKIYIKKSKWNIRRKKFKHVLKEKDVRGREERERERERREGGEKIYWQEKERKEKKEFALKQIQILTWRSLIKTTKV